MTVLEYDKREKACPVCKAARLIFITDAPKIRPIGKSVQYRCKDCATQEAEAAGDPIAVVHHYERRYLPTAWRLDRQPDAPAHLQPFVEERRAQSRGTSSPGSYGASAASDKSEAVPTLEARRMGSTPTVEEGDEE